MLFCDIIALAKPSFGLGLPRVGQIGCFSGKSMNWNASVSRRRWNGEGWARGKAAGRGERRWDRQFRGAGYAMESAAVGGLRGVAEDG